MKLATYIQVLLFQAVTAKKGKKAEKCLLGKVKMCLLVVTGKTENQYGCGPLLLCHKLILCLLSYKHRPCSRSSDLFNPKTGLYFQ